MTIERKNQLIAEYTELMSEFKFGLIVLIASHGTMFFCAISGFMVGAFLALTISFPALIFCDRRSDRIKEIRWELERG